ncbi:MAG TPA: hypothetical protein VFA02_00575 [Pseudacidobacterium sp.]|nr:hypothetical protein [Pseudacidobacterium sp.]
MTSECVEVSGHGPLWLGAQFPLRARYFPLGFPLELATNSALVMAAAGESWGHFSRKFDAPPLELSITVDATDKTPCALPHTPISRLQMDHLFHIVDAHNFMVSDLENGRSFGWITESTASATSYLRYHFLEAAGLSMISALRAVAIHAACISLHGNGVLLCGDSGAGKSSLAYALALRGWTLTSDDASYLPLGRRDRLIVGNPSKIRLRSSSPKLFPELSGRPVCSRFGGKPTIEVFLNEVPGISVSDTAFIRHVIFLDRTRPSVHELRPLDKNTAFSWFRHSFLTGISSSAAQESALDHFLDVNVMRMSYQDLGWAVERLRQLVLTGA